MLILYSWDWTMQARQPFCTCCKVTDSLKLIPLFIPIKQRSQSEISDLTLMIQVDISKQGRHGGSTVDNSMALYSWLTLQIEKELLNLKRNLIHYLKCQNFKVSHLSYSETKLTRKTHSKKKSSVNSLDFNSITHMEKTLNKRTQALAPLKYSCAVL